MENKKSASIQTRFAVSLAANILRSVISLITGILLARWLGPEHFGRMAFLLVTFLALRQFLDMASSSAFFTFLSQRKRSRRFVNFFWCWILIQFVFSLLVVGWLMPDSLLNIIWKGEEQTIILLALVAVFMQQNVWPIAMQMAEANRETVRAQKLNVVVVVVHLAVIIALWLGGQLFLPLIFIALIIEWTIAGWLATRMYREYDDQTDETEGKDDTAANVFNEFWDYCKPFIPYAWLSFAYTFADRWMLQQWGGATEQAYFAVAHQFSVVALLATASILRIFWKEIAEAKHQGDDEKVKRLYQRVSKSLYFIAVITAGGLMPWSAEIITLLLGTAYSGGTFTLMLMFLYPVQQSMGQIGGAMLYATENSRIQVILGSIFMALSIIAAYFMLAPESMIVPGLGLASQGLALKMVIMALIQVNVLAWFIAKIFVWKFEWVYQVVSLSLAVAAGWVAKLFVESIITAHVIVLMATSAAIYLILMSLVVYILPWLLGIERETIQQYFTNMLGKKSIL
jgi:O-antigen/teichoic acid export membrane protein